MQVKLVMLDKATNRVFHTTMQGASDVQEAISFAEKAGSRVLAAWTDAERLVTPSEDRAIKIIDLYLDRYQQMEVGTQDELAHSMMKEFQSVLKAIKQLIEEGVIG